MEILQRIQLLSEIAAGALNLVFPTRCPGCERIDTVGFCQDCRRMLEWIERKSACQRCGASGMSSQRIRGNACPACHNRNYKTTQAAAVLKYSGPLVPAIIRWKYRNQEKLTAVFAELMVDWITMQAPDWWEKIDYIVPAPHHPSTVRNRGFNPPEEIAGIIASRFAIPFLPRILFKIRMTAPQVRLKGDERFANLHESMHVFDKSMLEGKRVLIIDDVMTTGATMNECARAILCGGAEKVYGLVLARQSDSH
ncbi:MAG: ComF family protein [bacterium]|nr:ComF family protein [bacterium]